MKKKKHLYRFLKIVGAFILKVLYRIEIKNKDIVPKKGPLLIAANHISPMDAPLIGIVHPGTIYFFAAKELYDLPIIGWIIKKIELIPINRKKNDLGALRMTLRFLKQGEIIAIFPQGGIPSPTSEGKYDLKPGIAYLSIKSNTPILPVHISGTDRVIPRGRIFLRNFFSKIKVEFKDIIIPETFSHSEEKKRIEEIMEKLKREIFNL